MTIEQQHYDFKMKLNKIDSQQYRNLIIPQVDWILNEAQELFVKMISNPRLATQYGYEIGTRTLMDIRTVVVEDEEVLVVNNVAILPEKFWIYVSSYCRMKKGDCEKDSLKTYIKQHEEDFENNSFDKSSFTWKIINGIFNEDGIKLFSEDFEILKFYLSYIKKLRYIHNAKDFRGGTYTIPGESIPLQGSVNCELPESTHREIVDIAVLLATGQLQIPDYQIKKDKLSLNQII